MTLWKFDYKLLNDDGTVTSHLRGQFDDESVEAIQSRFFEFLRGCGYHFLEEDEERDRLREHNNTLKRALSEAIEELETMTLPVSAARDKLYIRWMEGLRAALQDVENDR
jgi:hypothetical protein